MEKKKLVATACVMLLIAVVVWYFGFSGEDTAVAALRAQMDQRESMSEADRDALRSQIGALSDEQRRQLFEPMMQSRASEMQARVFALLAMNEAQRRAELDRMINEMEQRRSNWGGNRGDRPGPPPGAANSPGRERGGQGMLDRTTPEMRATMAQMMSMMNQRRAERGMEPMRGPR